MGDLHCIRASQRVVGLDSESMEGQVVEMTEAEQAQHQQQLEQQLKAFWAKQLVEVRGVCEVSRVGWQRLTQCYVWGRRWNSWKWAASKVRSPRFQHGCNAVDI